MYGMPDSSASASSRCWTAVRGRPQFGQKFALTGTGKPHVGQVTELTSTTSRVNAGSQPGCNGFVAHATDDLCFRTPGVAGVCRRRCHQDIGQAATGASKGVAGMCQGRVNHSDNRSSHLRPRPTIFLPCGLLRGRLVRAILTGSSTSTYDVPVRYVPKCRLVTEALQRETGCQAGALKTIGSTAISLASVIADVPSAADTRISESALSSGSGPLGWLR